MTLKDLYDSKLKFRFISTGVVIEGKKDLYLSLEALSLLTREELKYTVEFGLKYH